MIPRRQSGFKACFCVVICEKEVFVCVAHSLFMHPIMYIFVINSHRRALVLRFYVGVELMFLSSPKIEALNITDV